MCAVYTERIAAAAVEGGASKTVCGWNVKRV